MRPERGLEFLAHLEDQRDRHGAVFPRRGGGVYVADPLIAREILANPAGTYREHSDFFKTRTGFLGPRSTQVAIGRELRQLLRGHALARAGQLPALIGRHLVPESAWPDAGNRLLFDHHERMLTGDNPSNALATTVRAVLERAVLAGARDRHSALARARFRARTMRVLSAEIAARRSRARGRSDPADVVDVIAGAAPADADDRELAEVYLSCLFAVAGSVGFLLGWSLYLMGTAASRTEPTRPDWVVREALRLWPVAWLFGRRPARTHQLAGIRVTPADHVVVCGYLVHRDPGHWSEPEQFRPGRWGSAPGQEAYIPFGWGPHACTGAAISMQAAEAIIEIITSTYDLYITVPESSPQVAAALAPPRFTLRLARVEGR